MKDITKEILMRQNRPYQLFSPEELSKPQTDLFGIKNPILVVAHQRVFDGFDSIVFIDTEDQRVKGIFWKKKNEEKSYGYIKNIKNGHIQYYEDKELIETHTDPDRETEKTLSDKVTAFKIKFINHPDKFDVYGRELFINRDN